MNDNKVWHITVYLVGVWFNVNLMGLKYNLKKHWPVHGMLCYWFVKAIYNKNLRLKIFSAYIQEKNIWTKTVDTSILLFLITFYSRY